MLKKNLIAGLTLAFALIVFLNKGFFLNELPKKWGHVSYSEKELVVTLSTPASDLSEQSLNLNNLTRTRNLYEGLVGFDRHLRLQPALAISWGNINETTWEFKLRQGVLFHDQSPFNAESVVESFNRAKESGSSQVKGAIQDIKSIEIKNPYLIQVTTQHPDPLILSTLTKLMISKPGNIGTGPYQIEEWEKGEHLKLIAFDDYWGRKTNYQRVTYQVIEDKKKREEAFSNGEIDILAAISRDQALNLPKEQIKNQYSLEINFLMFKLDHPLLKSRAVRQAIQSNIDPKAIEAIGNYFVRPTSQFIAPGVFGFNPSIKEIEYDEENRQTQLFGEGRQKITLDFLSTYRTLVDYLSKQLEEVGFLVKENMVSPTQLIENIKTNRSDLFIIGWQAENGDAGDFLDQFIHSKGEFNNGRYKNEKVDLMIEAAQQELNLEKRLKLLQNIILEVSKELIGIPLFESSRLYALKEGIDWEPRLDGLVLGVEVKKRD